MPYCYDTNEAVITLSGYDFAANSRDNPLVGRTFEYVRPDPQGPAFRKINISLSGFFIGNDHAELMTQFKELETILVGSNLSLTYKASASVVVESGRLVYVDGYTVPEDWMQYDGSYNIRLYYYAPCSVGVALSCTFTSNSTFNFSTRPPVWTRSIQQNRPSHRAAAQGSTATVTLSGNLYDDTSASLQAQITAMEAAFVLGGDGVLVYGTFSNPCKVVRTQIGPAVTMNFAPYSIELRYDIGSLVSLSKRIQFSRLHNNPIIKNKIFCGTRSVKQLLPSEQYVTYGLQIEAQDISTASSLMATELENTVIPGGMEMPGGTEIWDYDKVSVALNFTKYHDPPVLQNAIGS